MEPDREAYENDIPRYEREILNAGNEAFFTPAGYRIIRQILLPYPQSVVNEINLLQPALEDGAALQNKQMEALQSFLDTWMTQYQIETHPEML